MASKSQTPVLIVGATGHLGGRVVDRLLARGAKVRALVREGTDSKALSTKGVEVVRGDLTVPASLVAAAKGVRAVVTSAAGYTGRRKGDSLAKVDDAGNRNLVDAAKAAGVERFVFTSILTCDQAREVPHFWQKKLIEDYLAASGVPFVSIRPGAFIAPPEPGGRDFWGAGLRKGHMMSFGAKDVPWTWVHVDDVADVLARAVDEPRAVGKKIDIGSDPPASIQEIADAFSKILGRTIRVKGMGMMGAAFAAMAVVSPRMRDMKSMGAYFATGKYVADTSVQARLFGPVPKLEDALRRYASAAGLLP